MEKHVISGVSRPKYYIKKTLKKATRLPLPIRRAIVFGGMGLVLLLLALLIAGIASCSGKESLKGAQIAGEAVPSGELPQEAVPEQPSSLSSLLTPLEDPDDPSYVPPVYPEDTDTPPEENPVQTAALPSFEPSAEPTATPDPGPQYEKLKKHSKSDAVTTLQNRLMELGYLEIDEPTNYFGSSTEYAVILFQRQHGLTQDGVAGQNTQVLLFSKEAEHYCLKEGAEGRDVKQLQQQLCDLGYLSEKEIDHVYGATTKAAIQAFQKRNKLSDDGLAGEKTLAKLYSDEARISSALEKQLEAEKKAAEKKAAEDKKAKTSPTPKKDTRIDKLISAAKSKLGCEYVLGDRGPDTFDCSGFLHWCLRQAGISTTRLNAAGFSNKSSWKKIDKFSDCKKGDLLFFRSDESSRVSHCGIYIGSGDMIDASSGNGVVIKRPVSSYWRRNFVCARRPW